MQREPIRIGRYYLQRMQDTTQPEREQLRAWLWVTRSNPVYTLARLGPLVVFWRRRSDRPRW